jgi:hypothetical protein
MGKLILGIITVVFLDLVFVGYTYIATDIEPAVAANAIESKFEKGPELGSMDELTEPALPAVQREVTPVRSARVRARPVSAAMDRGQKLYDRSLRAARPDPGRPAGVDPSALQVRYAVRPTSGIRIIKRPNSTVILYHGPENSRLIAEKGPAAKRPAYPENSHLVTVRVRETKKTSYIARVLPVFKKPWELIKNLASKFR